MEGHHPAYLLQLALAVQAVLAAADMMAASMQAAEAVLEYGILPAAPLAFFREAGECQLRFQ